MNENLTRRPPSGLSVLEMAQNGSGIAQKKIKEYLTNGASSSLPLTEWSKMGLESAKKLVEQLTKLVR